jgi:hypothetical protein
MVLDKGHIAVPFNRDFRCRDFLKPAESFRSPATGALRRLSRGECLPITIASLLGQYTPFRSRHLKSMTATAVALAIIHSGPAYCQAGTSNTTGCGADHVQCLVTAINMLWLKHYKRELEVADAEYKKTSAAYQKAMQTGDSKIGSTWKLELTLKEKQLAHARSVERTVKSIEFKDDLEANLARVNKQLANAQASLDKLKSAADRLQSADDKQRVAIFRDIQGSLKEEDRLRHQLRFNEIQAALKGAATVLSSPAGLQTVVKGLEKMLPLLAPALQQEVRRALEVLSDKERIEKLSGALEQWAAREAGAHEPDHRIREDLHAFITAIAALAYLNPASSVVLNAGKIGLTAAEAGTLATAAIAVAPAVTGIALDGFILLQEKIQRDNAYDRMMELDRVGAYLDERISTATEEVKILGLRRELAQQWIENQKQLSGTKVDQ